MDNNQTPVTEEQKSGFMKSLAIVGFVAVICLLVWIAVQVVGLMPSAFQSLASLADSIYNYNDDVELSVSNSDSIVDSSEIFTVTWNEVKPAGTMWFSYECTDGAALNVIDSIDGAVALACGTKINVSEKTSLDLMISSERKRFVDVSYSLTFTPDKADREEISKTRKVTIVNQQIPANNVVAEEDAEEDADGPDESTTEVDTPDTNTPVVTTPKPATPTAPAKPVVTTHTVYYAPVSDPNGTTDLAVAYRAQGVIQNGLFYARQSLETGDMGAVQFSVKNLGTKTSDTWTFAANLPTGITYKSKTQKALKPNEEALLTINFDGLTRGVKSFSVNLDIDGDSSRTNNQFSQNILVN